ncbi:uncharacterized protein si:ch211-227n13.3 isoform X2 [Plectropomus leopardus]|nr:uncharacterized protein si:ch211-227n13.3 isoform X2 [Plectropomus leopardus]XP_042353747.1 uncharacterized protein si:ch211-227n13.3 isoform X2 [Plectropomus leopardus]
MYPKRSSRLSEASRKSVQRSPSPNEDVIQRRVRAKRQRTGLERTREDDSVVTDEGKDRDIIDIINSTHDAKEEDEGFVKVADEGVYESDDDRHSVTSSIASGPSLLHHASPKTLRSSRVLCSACKTVQQRAKRMKAPIKDKLFNNDPKSLTCDQWLLIKNWRPRRRPSARGRLLIHLQLVKERLQMKKRRRERDSPACSRPHAFLQRNLRRVRVPVKKGRKKNRRKRTRDGSKSPRVAKQQRLHGNTHSRHISDTSVDMSVPRPASGSPGFQGLSDREINSQADTDVTVEFNDTRDDGTPRQAPPKKRGGFRDLLVQLRGNSTIVRETR